jgi:tRNA-dihydrouridine synthase
MSNFWQQLNKPIFCLAPMEEVTDAAFREMFARYSTQHEARSMNHEGAQNASCFKFPASSFVMFTEFINVDGLTHPEGRKKLEIDLKYTENQRPIVAQLWGKTPAKFEEAAKIIVDLGFDGIDINMGCPQDKEVGLGACAALIREPQLAREIIGAVKKAAGNLPVSVKTRIGYSKAGEMDGWVKNLLQTDIAALTLHGRTKQEKSKVPAHWDKITEAVKIRDAYFNPTKSVIARSAPDEAILYRKRLPRPSDAFGARNDTTVIIGNGDVRSREEGLERVKQTGCDGVMVGRGAFGNPWFFRRDYYHLTIKERLSVMLEHAELFNQILGGHKSFFIMRKHFKAYATGFDGAHELRAKLLSAKDLEETKKIINEYLKITQV